MFLVMATGSAVGRAVSELRDVIKGTLKERNYNTSLCRDIVRGVMPQ